MQRVAFVAPLPLPAAPAGRPRPSPRVSRTPTATASQRSSWAQYPPSRQAAEHPSPLPPPPPQPVEPSPPPTRAPPAAPERPPAQGLVPYFAYFSNLSPRRLGPQSMLRARRFPLHHSVPATLPAHRLSFRLPGPPPEPAFATIEPVAAAAAAAAARPADGPSEPMVHGVLHYVTPTDFASLQRSEGAGPATAAPFPFPPLAPMRVADVVVHTAYGPVSARTFVAARLPPPWLPVPPPSRRYVQLAVEGARYWRLDPAYVRDVLAAVPTDAGPLSLFGLAVEPRPHPLDRPSTLDKFGPAETELFSPFKPIDAPEAVAAFDRAEQHAASPDLRLVPLTARRPHARPLYFVPGIDGAGKSVISQVAAIEEEAAYNLSAFVLPFDNRQSLEQLADTILAAVHADAAGKPVSIVSESMGAVLSILVSLENIRRKQLPGNTKPTVDIDLLFMLNPATSFARSTPRPLWEFLLSLDLPQAAYSALITPVLMPFLIDITSAQTVISPEMAPRLRRMLTTIPAISQTLPRDALAHRTALLAKLDLPDERLTQLTGKFGPADIAVIGVTNDSLLPSLSEVFRMRRVIPRLYSGVLSFGGHATMFDTRFSLAGLLRPFADGPRGTAKYVPEQTRSQRTLRKQAALRKKFAGSIESNPSKSRTELRDLRNYLQDSLRDHSPVFVGEENIAKLRKDKPVLFVCNHTLLAWFDGAHLILRFLDKHNVQLQALANPSLLEGPEFDFPGTGGASKEQYKAFGVNKITPNRMVAQMANDCWSLLFPGGAREALKQPGDKKYGVMWTDEAEFVRACAVFGATIVPIGTVGTEDMVHVVAGSDVTRRVVETGLKLTGQEYDLDQVIDRSRKWQGRGQPRGRGTEPGVENSMLPPLLLPVGPDRIYFMIGEPIEVPDEAVWDARAEKEIYDKARRGVENCVDTLLRRRELDEYRSKESREKYREEFGDGIEPPAGRAWIWATGEDSYLGEHGQPPL